HDTYRWTTDPPLQDTRGVGQHDSFGSAHAATWQAAMCDGSVRVFTGRTDPSVLRALATIAGKGADPVPGD
ncbi:MAG: DUF1559 domain-containing protein, partial [Gemmata sp.]